MGPKRTHRLEIQKQAILCYPIWPHQADGSDRFVYYCLTRRIFFLYSGANQKRRCIQFAITRQTYLPRTGWETKYTECATRHASPRLEFGHGVIAKGFQIPVGWVSRLPWSVPDTANMLKRSTVQPQSCRSIWWSTESEEGPDFFFPKKKVEGRNDRPPRFPSTRVYIPRDSGTRFTPTTTTM